MIDAIVAAALVGGSISGVIGVIKINRAHTIHDIMIAKQAEADSMPKPEELGDALGDGAQWEDDLNQLVRNYKYLVTKDALPIDWVKFEFFIDAALRGEGPPPKYLSSEETIAHPNFYLDPRHGVAEIHDMTEEEKERRLAQKVKEALEAGEAISLPEGYDYELYNVDQHRRQIVSVFRTPSYNIGKWKREDSPFIMPDITTEVWK